MAMVNVLGVAVVDAISGPLAAYPTPRSQPQVITERVWFCPGGGAVNTAATLAQLGINVALFTKVGADANGRLIVETLAGYGVDTSSVVLAAGESTPFTFVGLHPDGDRTFIHTPGTNLTFGRADLDLDSLLDCGYLLYPDLNVLPNLDGEAATEILSAARAHGAITLLDECWGLGPSRERLETVAAFADYLLPSADDIAALYPDLPPPDLVSHLAGLLATAPALAQRAALLKMGVDGVLLRAPGAVAADSDRRDIGPVSIPAAPLSAEQLVDTTGAGDAFDAGFIAALTAGLSLESAARYGTRVAAERIKVLGASTPIDAPIVGEQSDGE